MADACHDDDDDDDDNDDDSDDDMDNNDDDDDAIFRMGCMAARDVGTRATGSDRTPASIPSGPGGEHGLAFRAHGLGHLRSALKEHLGAAAN